MKRLASVVATTAVALSIGSLSPVTAQSELPDEFAVPVEFHGTIECVSVISGGLPDVRPDVTINRGEIYGAVADISDPRLEGDYTAFFNSNNFKTPGEPSSVGSGAWRIENDDGAWQGSYHVIGLPFEGSVVTTTVTTALIGEGAYEGLVAVWESEFDNRACSWDVRGLIIEGELPPVPQPASLD